MDLVAQRVLRAQPERLAGPWPETVVIESNGAFDGPVTLTAGAAPTLADLAGLAGLAAESTGRSVTTVVMDPQERSAAPLAAGRPAFLGSPGRGAGLLRRHRPAVGHAARAGAAVGARRSGVGAAAVHPDARLKSATPGSPVTFRVS